MVTSSWSYLLINRLDLNERSPFTPTPEDNFRYHAALDWSRGLHWVMFLSEQLHFNGSNSSVWFKIKIMTNHCLMSRYKWTDHGRGIYCTVVHLVVLDICISRSITPLFLFIDALNSSFSQFTTPSIEFIKISNFNWRTLTNADCWNASKKMIFHQQRWISCPFPNRVILRGGWQCSVSYWPLRRFSSFKNGSWLKLVGQRWFAQRYPASWLFNCKRVGAKNARWNPWFNLWQVDIVLCWFLPHEWLELGRAKLPRTNQKATGSQSGSGQWKSSFNGQEQRVGKLLKNEI